MRCAPIHLLAIAAGALGCRAAAERAQVSLVTPGALAAASSASAGARRLPVAPGHSRLEVQVSDKITGVHVLTFDTWRGELQLEPPPVRLSLSIDIASMRTHSDDVRRIVRDEMLEASRYPEASLRLSLEPGEGSELVASGLVSLHGTERVVSFPVSVGEAGPARRVRAAFELPRGEFGVRRGDVFDGLINEDFRVVLDLCASPDALEERPAAAPPGALTSGRPCP